MRPLHIWTLLSALYTFITLTSTAAEVQLAVAPRVALPTGVPVYGEDLMNFFGTNIEQLTSRSLRARMLQKNRDTFSSATTASIRVEVTQVPKTSILSVKATGAPEAVGQKYLALLVQEFLATKIETKEKNYREKIEQVTKAIESSKDNAEVAKMLTDYRNQLLFALRVDTKPNWELVPQE